MAFVAFIAALGYIYGIAFNSPNMVIFVTVFAVGYALISYFLSTRIALGIAGAKPIEKKDAPQLYRIVENLAITSGLPMPKVYIMDDPALNAFATGRDPKRAVVAVTTGLMAALEDEELEGVIAHEMSHVGNYDIRFMAIVMVLVTVVSLLSNFIVNMGIFGGGDDEGNSNPLAIVLAIVAALIAPLVAMLLQLAVSRKREYLADASGALLTRYPEGLARALEKIEASSKPVAHASTTNAHMYFSNPFGRTSKSSFITGLFSTHPPTADRIKRLRDMEGKA